MLTDDLQKIIQKSRAKNLPLEYIKIELKEELIYYALNFIYNSPKWNNLVFGGGTALKVIGKTARLSEDLDMDHLEKMIDSEKFVLELIAYFKNYGLKNINFALRQNGKIIILKFPILRTLGIVKNKRSESDFLYLKIEIEKNSYSSYGLKATPISRDNLFFVARNYDLNTLFANKIGAIMGRKNKLFYDKYDFRGRDFYDLIWFLENNIKPNLKRVKQIIKKEQGILIKTYNDVWMMLRKRIKNIDTGGIYLDMKNLVEFPLSAKRLAGDYLDIYDNFINMARK